MKRRTINSTLGMAIVLSLAMGARAEVSLAAPTFRVDCSSGQTLGQALAVAKPGSTIELSGVCNERVTIAQDGITLDGGGSAVVDGGGIPPFDIDLNATVTVDGARNVTLRGLKVQNGPAEGVLGMRSASFVIENVQIQGHFRGVLLSASTAELAGVTVIGGFAGVQAFAGSRLLLTGEVDISMTQAEGFSLLGATAELRGGFLSLHDNFGMFSLTIVADSNLTVFGFEATGEGGISVTSNQGAGILIANGALEIGGLTDSTPVIESSGNAGPGIVLTAGGKLLNAFGWARVVAMNNPVGIDASVGSVIFVNGGLEVSANFVAGLSASGADLSLSPGINPVSITGNGSDGVSDVVLSFGTHSTINADVTIGSPLICDGTVLSQGAITC